jgi:hypothetical protein
MEGGREEREGRRDEERKVLKESEIWRMNIKRDLLKSTEIHVRL